jgi:hypothetical protein
VTPAVEAGIAITFGRRRNCWRRKVLRGVASARHTSHGQLYRKGVERVVSEISVRIADLERLYSPEMAETGLWAKLAKRLGVPFWGQVLCLALIAAFGAFGTLLWKGYTHLTNIENSIRILASKQPPETRDLVQQILTAANTQIKQQVRDEVATGVRPMQTELDRLNATIKGVAEDQRKLRGQQEALNRLQDPDRILAIIRAQVQLAGNANKILPVSDVADFKNALDFVPASAREYWTTVAAVVNYQSLVNQLTGKAPDPSKVSRPCAGLTEGSGGNNFFGGFVFRGCVVDLDSTLNTLSNVTFADSVIRYHGGRTDLRNVRFLNCRFILDLRPDGKPPTRERFVMALLKSPDQTSITVPSS